MAVQKQDFVSILSQLDISTNELITYFQVIVKLIKKYGKRLHSKSILEIINKSDTNVSGLITLLVLYKKCDISTINAIVKELKKHPDYIPNFDVHIIEDSHKHNIQEKIKTKFPGSTVNLHQNIDLGIEVNGEGWHYKRNIDQDLQRILG